MSFKPFLLSLITLGFIFSTLCCSSQEQEEVNLQDFDFLERGISFEEVVHRVGEPDRDVGSGVYLFQYDLTDGRSVTLQFVTLAELTGAWILNEDGTQLDLLEGANPGSELPQ